LNRTVLDASVVLKWYLVDEEYGQNALNLLDKYMSSGWEFLAPSLLEFEVVNGLTLAQKRGRLKEEVLGGAMEGFVQLDLKLVNLSHFYPKVFHYCKLYGCSAHDASYLGLADAEGIALITGDKKLYDMVKKNIRWIKWIGDIE
jgi:predicted nucleic acid-binding protein